MGNKYINNLRNKLLNLGKGDLRTLNESWAYDYLYGKAQPAMSGPSNYGDDVGSYGDDKGAPPASGPNDVVGREIKNNPDGSFTVITKYGNQTTKSATARNREELKRILGI